MGLKRLSVAIGGTVLAAGMASAVIVQLGGDDPEPKRPAASATEPVQNQSPVPPATSPGAGQAATAAPGATPPGSSATAAPTAQDIVSSVMATMEQLRQAAANGGQPRALTPEEIKAALQQQLAQLGVKL